MRARQPTQEEQLRILETYAMVKELEGSLRSLMAVKVITAAHCGSTVGEVIFTVDRHLGE